MVFLFWGVGTMWNRIVLTKFVRNILSPILGHKWAPWRPDSMLQNKSAPQSTSTLCEHPRTGTTSNWTNIKIWNQLSSMINRARIFMMSYFLFDQFFHAWVNFDTFLAFMNTVTLFIGPINAHFDYILSLGHIFTNICIIAHFLVIFRLIFNIPLYIVHRIITHKYYNVLPTIGKKFYLTFLFLETVKVRDNGF
jgi:hypothetical protein